MFWYSFHLLLTQRPPSRPRPNINALPRWAAHVRTSPLAPPTLPPPSPEPSHPQRPDHDIFEACISFLDVSGFSKLGSRLAAVESANAARGHHDDLHVPSHTSSPLMNVDRVRRVRGRSESFGSNASSTHGEDGGGGREGGGSSPTSPKRSSLSAQDNFLDPLASLAEIDADMVAEGGDTLGDAAPAALTSTAYAPRMRRRARTVGARRTASLEDNLGGMREESKREAHMARQGMLQRWQSFRNTPGKAAERLT